MWDGKEGCYLPPRQPRRKLSFPSRVSSSDFPSLASSGPLALKVYLPSGDIPGEPRAAQGQKQFLGLTAPVRGHGAQRRPHCLVACTPALSPTQWLICTSTSSQPMEPVGLVGI